MKKILVIGLLLMAFAFTSQAQLIPVSSGTVVHTMSFKQDSIKATDTNWVAFYVPYTMNVLAVQAVAAIRDTGTSGSGAGVFTLYKYGTSTAIVKDSILTANVVVSESPSSSTTAKLAKGYIYKIKWEQSGSERLDKVTLLLHYTQ